MTDRLNINRERFIFENARGSLIDDVYTIGKKLGQGSYGSVAACCLKESRSIVRAVKTIPKNSIKKNHERFMQEIEIMKKMDHPNIVKLYEVFEDAKNIYLVMELLTGGELFDRIIDEGFFSEPMAAVLMRQIFSAIFYCHSQNIAHRDLKPENFIFGTPQADNAIISEAPIKVIDFGLATAFECQTNGEGTSMQTKAGTPYYVAPQVLAGAYDEKCDVWSCGVILYVLLCGYPPFYGDTDADVLKRVRRGRFIFPEEDFAQTSRDVKDLIRKCLNIDPVKRFTAKEAFHHTWIQTFAKDAKPTKLHRGMVQKLRNFKNMSSIKKVTLTCIAQQYTTDVDVEKLKKIFVMLDKDGDGTLSVDELKVGLRQSSIAIPKDLQELVNSIDSDCSGRIDYTEFLAATISKATYMKEEALWVAFRIFDRDGNGTICKEELRAAIENMEGEESMTNEELDTIMQEADTDGNGEIDFDEFKSLMRNQQHAVCI